MTTTIREILALEVPTLIEEYKRWVTRQYERLVKTYGESFVGASSSWEDGKFYANFRQHLKNKESGPSYRVGGPLEVNPVATERLAKEWAEAVALAWATKLEEKLGKDATGVGCIRISDSDYHFVAERQGRKIRVSQQRVYKTSSRGMPFYQFPARLYVDGQFMPEAKVKALFKDTPC